MVPVTLEDPNSERPSLSQSVGFTFTGQSSHDLPMSATGRKADVAAWLSHLDSPDTIDCTPNRLERIFAYSPLT